MIYTVQNPQIKAWTITKKSYSVQAPALTQSTKKPQNLKPEQVTKAHQQAKGLTPTVNLSKTLKTT